MSTSEIYLSPIFTSENHKLLKDSVFPIKTFNKGETIIHVGQQFQYLHYLIKGKVKYTITVPNGEETIMHITIAPAFFGEVPFFSGLPSFGSFIACEKSRVQMVERKDLSRECLDALCIQMARKIRVANLQYESTFNTAEQRVARLIYILSTSERNSKIEVTQKELAHIAGLHHMTVNKVLKKLVEKKIIVVGRRTIELIDFTAIMTIAGL